MICPLQFFSPLSPTPKGAASPPGLHGAGGFAQAPYQEVHLWAFFVVFFLRQDLIVCSMLLLPQHWDLDGMVPPYMAPNFF